MQALEHLLRLFEEQGDTVTAIRYAQRLLGLDPLSEDRYRRLMRLFALKNDRLLSWASHGQRNTCDSVHGSLYPGEPRTRESEVERAQRLLVGQRTQR
jgi:hypothetical protein